MRENRIASRLAGTNRAVVEAVHAALSPGRPADPHRTAADPRKAASAARRILDVGCGEGWLSHLLSREGYDVMGFDGSAELIKSASTGPGRFLQLDYGTFLQDPSIVGCDYDAIVCNFALFDADLDSFLDALSTRLAKAGVLIVQTMHPFGRSNDRLYEDGWRTETFESIGTEFKEMPWFFRTIGSWINVLHRVGLVVVRCDEPMSGETGKPLSLVLTCRATAHASTDKIIGRRRGRRG